MCGNCCAPLPEGAVLCTQCGFEVETGRRLTTTTQAPAPLPRSSNPGDYFKGFASVAGLVIITALSVFIAYSQAPGDPLIRPRGYWIFDILGWRVTWILASCLFGLFTLKAIYQLAKTGKVDLEELEEM